VPRFWAFLAYNVYSDALVWAFQINTAYEFDPEMVKRLAGGATDTPSHWGWGNHYLWRLCAAIIATVWERLRGFIMVIAGDSRAAIKRC
jgi:hypothetical protein